MAKPQRKRRNKRVLVFGTFDLFHPGHVSFLKQARRYGDELLVAVARDHVVRWLKGQPPVDAERIRAANVRQAGLAKRVLLARHNPARRFEFIRRLKPDIICLGYDQRVFADDLKNELVRRGITSSVVRLKPFRPRTYKSSILRRRLEKKRA